ncbi:OB-fold putative lipoprotein [Deltaproteobacteria bacterium OttesenSCG-928-K17]|nr:OB-fold putative lipoprotein [Deltaproteobacteria bacterium OttesenSCG-928-K17]
MSKTLPAALLLIVFGLLGPAAACAQRQYMRPVPVTPPQLTEAYKRNFHQADVDYTGKLLLVTGRIKSIRLPQSRVHDIHQDKLYAFMTLDAGRNNRPLAVYFWDWQAERLNTLRVGATVTVMGFCQGVPPQLSLIESCVYPAGCGGPKRNFRGPYYEIPPSPPPQRRP